MEQFFLAVFNNQPIRYHARSQPLKRGCSCHWLEQQLLSRPRCHPNAKRPNRRGEKRRLSHSAFDSTSDGRISLLVRPSKLNRFLLHPLSRSLFASIHGIAAASGLAASAAVSSIPNSARSDNNSETERGERQGELQNDHGRRWRCS